jgi:DNA-binding XRE family transcriptional regulator
MNSFIKQLRLDHDLSQDFVAKKIGVTRPTYVAIESGERDLKLPEAQKLAEVFGISLTELSQEEKFAAVEVVLEEPSSYSSQNEPVRISVPKEQHDKFREVLLYILEEIGARPNVGEAVLCKLLYFIDFDYYEKYEEQLIGAKYLRNHYGPTPVAFPDIIKKMEDEGDLEVASTKYFQHEQKKYLPRRVADLSLLTAREKELIDFEIQRFKNFNAKMMCDYSHEDVPWKITPAQKMIDYEKVFYRTKEYSQRLYDESDED